MVNLEDLSRKDLEADSGKLDQLSAENQALRNHIQSLEETAARDKRDREGSVPLREKEELLAEISRLKKLTQSASEVC